MLTSSVIRCSTNSACSSTNHSSLPKTPAAQRDIGYWKPCVSTPWRSSASQAKPKRSVIRHRDHYTAMADRLDTPSPDGLRKARRASRVEIDNLRAAFVWSRRRTTTSRTALEMATSLQPLWLMRGRVLEGGAWLDAAVSGSDSSVSKVSPALRARALADTAMLNSWLEITDALEQADEALVLARDVGDPALLTRALAARCSSSRTITNSRDRISRRQSRSPASWTTHGGCARYSAVRRTPRLLQVTSLSPSRSPVRGSNSQMASATILALDNVHGH